MILTVPKKSDWMIQIRTYILDAKELKEKHPDAALMKCRKASECIQFHLFHEEYGCLPNKHKFQGNLMGTGKDGIGHLLTKKMKFLFEGVQKLGNLGCHHDVGGEEVDSEDAEMAIDLISKLFKNVFDEELDLKQKTISSAKFGDIVNSIMKMKIDKKDEKIDPIKKLTLNKYWKMVYDFPSDDISKIHTEFTTTHKNPEIGSSSEIVEQGEVTIDIPSDEEYSITKFTTGSNTKRKWPKNPSDAAMNLMEIFSFNGMGITWGELKIELRGTLPNNRRWRGMVRDIRVLNKQKKGDVIDWNIVGTIEEVFIQLRDYYLNTDWWSKSPGKMPKPNKKALLKPYFEAIAKDLAIDTFDADLIHIIGKAMEISTPHENGWYEPLVIELAMKSLDPSFSLDGLKANSIEKLVDDYHEHFEKKVDRRYKPEKLFIRRRE